MIESEVRAEIAKTALIGTGRGIAWDTLLKKQPLRICYVGGSVTHGYAQHQVYKDAFPALTAAALADMGITAETTVIAEPGMDAMAANLLADRCIIAAEPDIVFVEFAINETTLRPSVWSVESLVRRLLTAKKPSVVCMLTLRNFSGYSAESYMLPLAEHYGLPCISVRQGLNAALEAGKLTWSDYADEESHPNPDGHRVIADCVAALFAAARNLPDEPHVPLPEAWLDAPFLSMRTLFPGDPFPACLTMSGGSVVDTKEWFFDRAWELKAGESITVELNSRIIELAYEEDTLDDLGRCVLTLDGQPLREPLRANSIYGWGNPRHAEILLEPQAAPHVLKLHAEDGRFRLLGIGFSER